MTMSNSNLSNDVIFEDDAYLRNRTTIVNTYLLLCSNATCTKQFTKSSTIWHIDYVYDWLIRLKCKKCHQEWAVCSTCNHCTRTMTCKRSIDMHRNTYHNSNQANYSKKRKNNILDDIDNYLSSKKNKENDNIISKALDSNEQELMNDVIEASVIIYGFPKNNVKENACNNPNDDNQINSVDVSCNEKGK
jgi:hypothetical protein